MKYLGYHLSPEGLTMSPDKITTIADWLEPCKVKDIQLFLGFANFYHCFIFNYSDIMVPLTWLTQKDTPWNFSEECHCSFNALKHAFTTTPILTHFIPDTPITMETDALDYAVASILSITCADGELHPVAFYSWTLTAPELNYDTNNKELLAIFEAFQTWHHYLEGSMTPVDVIMDHKNRNTFPPRRFLPAGKPGGPNSYPHLILSSASALGSSVLSLTPLLDNGTSTPKRGIVATPR